MTSLEAVQADGYYIPADFDWRKHKSVNHYHGNHPLRERAAKISQVRGFRARTLSRP